MAKKYNPFLIELGERIRTFRKQKNMTQMELAEKVGSQCSKNVISSYENGEKEMGVNRLSEISNALKVSPALLLGDADDNSEIMSLFSQLNEENQGHIKKQMEILLKMQ